MNAEGRPGQFRDGVRRLARRMRPADRRPAEEPATTLERSERTEHLPGVYGNRPRGAHPCRGLFAATEAFGVPLWDLPFEVSGADRPTAIERARRLARRLLDRGWTVVIVEEGTGSPEREVALDEALAVLAGDEPWEPSQQMFSLVATDAGRDAYRGHSDRRRSHRVGFNF